MTGRFRIIDLQDIRQGDLARVGRKALHLGVMMQAGFPVPRGFVIPTDACEEAIQSSSEAIELDERLRVAIVTAYRARGFQRVAVRSSATLEDLRHASFAGIYTTCVNVASEVELIHAVAECLRSMTAHAPPCTGGRWAWRRTAADVAWLLSSRRWWMPRCRASSTP